MFYALDGSTSVLHRRSSITSWGPQTGCCRPGHADSAAASSSPTSVWRTASSFQNQIVHKNERFSLLAFWDSHLPLWVEEAIWRLHKGISGDQNIKTRALIRRRSLPPLSMPILHSFFLAKAAKQHLRKDTPCARAHQWGGGALTQHLTLLGDLSPFMRRHCKGPLLRRHRGWIQNNHSLHRQAGQAVQLCTQTERFHYT